MRNRDGKLLTEDTSQALDCEGRTVVPAAAVPFRGFQNNAVASEISSTRRAWIVSGISVTVQALNKDDLLAVIALCRSHQ